MSDAQADRRTAGFGRLLAGMRRCCRPPSSPSPPRRLPSSRRRHGWGDCHGPSSTWRPASARSCNSNSRPPARKSRTGHETTGRGRPPVTARDQTIATQQQELTDLKAQNDADACRARRTSQAHRARDRGGATGRRREHRRGTEGAARERANRQSADRDDRRPAPAGRGQRRPAQHPRGRAGQPSGPLANLTAERDRLRRAASAEQGRLTELEANIESLRAERDQLTTFAERPANTPDCRRRQPHRRPSRHWPSANRRWPSAMPHSRRSAVSLPA